MNYMSQSEIGWLTGIIDGEGSISIVTQKTNGNKSSRIQVKMTDEDVINNLRLITGVGNVYKTKTMPSNRKQTWYWTVYKVKDVSHILCTITGHPLLSQRRKMQILDATEVNIEAIRRIKLDSRARGHCELNKIPEYLFPCGHPRILENIRRNNRSKVCKTCAKEYDRKRIKL